MLLKIVEAFYFFKLKTDHRVVYQNRGYPQNLCKIIPRAHTLTESKGLIWISSNRFSGLYATAGLDIYTDEHADIL